MRSKLSLPKLISRLILWMLGWQTDFISNNHPKYVLIGAYHTSNWDFVIGYLVMTAIGLRLSWVGKHTLFYWPLGWFMRILGGIPVNRRISKNFVDQIVETFRSYNNLIVAIAPEGTRGKTDNWKSGFYYIALGAKVPIALGYVDYRRKFGGIGAFINPTGNIDGDLDKIREFYSKITAKFPEKAGEIRISKKAE